MNFEDNDLERLARDMHEGWESPALWPRIQAGLSAPKRRRFPLWPALVLATATLLVLALGVAEFGLKQSPKATDGELLSRDALSDVEQSEAAYARSIEKLLELARPSLTSSSAPVAAMYREKLVVLDAAIADLKKSADTNPYNAYLRSELASLYRDKQLTLRSWLSNANGN